MTVVFSTFPRTEAPPDFVSEVCLTFQSHKDAISTQNLSKGLTSDQVLETVRPALVSLGCHVESGKTKTQKIQRPVFFGENAVPYLQYDVDAWHPEWRAGLEVEAGRAKMGNAIYRDLIQALVMVELDYLFLAVPLTYKYRSSGKVVHSKDYEHTVSVADALYGHSRIKMPFSLCVLGY